MSAGGFYTLQIFNENGRINIKTEGIRASECISAKYISLLENVRVELSPIENLLKTSSRIVYAKLACIITYLFKHPLDK